MNCLINVYIIRHTTLTRIYDTIKLHFMWYTYVYARVSITVECCGDTYSAFMPILLGLEHNFTLLNFHGVIVAESWLLWHIFVYCHSFSLVSSTTSNYCILSMKKRYTFTPWASWCSSFLECILVKSKNCLYIRTWL